MPKVEQYVKQPELSHIGDENQKGTTISEKSLIGFIKLIIHSYCYICI